MKYSYENNLSDRQFDSIDEFLHFIETTPLNSRFCNSSSHLASNDTSAHSTKWTGTSSYSEAVKMLKNGWEDMAKKIEQQLKLATKSVVTKTTPRPTYSAAGYQASVPRYLQGMPDSMIYSKRVPLKQKIITINKQINYTSCVSAETIIEESTKALSIVAKLEAQGYRVNLNVVTCSEGIGSYKEIVRIRIKSASEKMSVAKMAFPLVNPSMLRRLIFKYRETNPESSQIGYFYGSTIYNASQWFEDKANSEYYLPPMIDNEEEFLKNFQNL